MNEKLVNKREKTETLSNKVERINRWLSISIFAFSAIALFISVIPILVSSSQQKLWTWLLFAIACLFVGIILSLYRRKGKIQRKQIISERELTAEKKKNQILNSVFLSLQEANTGKMFGTLRYTYGKVSDWNPINYEKNRLVYDVHDQIRNILKSLQRVVISIAPDRFNDKNVSVDLVCTYPEDNNNDCDVPVKDYKGLKSDSSTTGKAWRITRKLVFGGSEKKFSIMRSGGKKTDKPWKLISSGDLSGNHNRTLDYLSDPFSFYSLVSFFGSWYANNKYEAQHFAEITKDDTIEEKKRKTEEENLLIEEYLDHLRKYVKESHMTDEEKEKKLIRITRLGTDKKFFLDNVKDFENSKWNSTSKTWDGSAIGATICVRNDNPEHILVKSILTINTFGEPIHIPEGDSEFDKDGLSERDYEKLFLKQILGAYSTLIASELSQMYIRHQLQNGKLSATTGAPIITTETPHPKE